METKVNFLPEAEGRIVYVRPVAVAELPAEIQAQAEGLDRLYALHRPDGERLALVRDRDMAFALARQNDLAPVNAH
ncbi:MAG: DUF1150 family protein [Gemmobacter sp.]|uniref:DUF1150 family protein n=1 Tax=Gemmobacter sp. TaxID=1898957 RepID=UPI001A5F2F6D|nr:DUF1150 family protein [Gemmobacter sp.]MBL8563854.1 DUF1150 family protein [Gemmobacter sp.]